MDAAFGAVQDARVGRGDGGAGTSDGGVVDAGLGAVFVFETCWDVNIPFIGHSTGLELGMGWMGTNQDLFPAYRCR